MGLTPIRLVVILEATISTVNGWTFRLVVGAVAVVEMLVAVAVGVIFDCAEVLKIIPDECLVAWRVEETVLLFVMAWIRIEPLASPIGDGVGVMSLLVLLAVPV